MPKLLDEVRDSIRVRHYSIRTEDAYVRWIKEYILFHKKRLPRWVSQKSMTSYLTSQSRGTSRFQLRPRPSALSCFSIAFEAQLTRSDR